LPVQPLHLQRAEQRTFIPAIVSFIEGIYYLTLSDEEFARRY
jgi:hypothetical protein